MNTQPIRQFAVRAAVKAAISAALGLSLPWAMASGVVSDVNGAATPGDFVFGGPQFGWKWTAPMSFTWDGLGSSFHSCCQFNVLSPSQATLLIATDTPANGGAALFSGQLNNAGHASFAGINVTAGTSYFIGLSGLQGGGNFAVGVNIANWVPAQAPGTVNLSGFYHGNNFDTFVPQSVINGLQQNPFAAPILRFEGTLAVVPEPSASALLLAGLAMVGWGLRRARSA